jgi:Kef-type K+ transport system membrane component KefB
VSGLRRPALLAVVVATSSGAVALPVLQGLGGAGRTVLVTTVWIAVADIGTVLALPLVLSSGRPLRIVAGAGAVAGAAAALYAGGRLLRGSRPLAQLRAKSREHGWGLDLRVSLLALFTCAWLAARFGTSLLFAGFAVGAVVALLGEPRRVADQLIGVGEGFAIPLFFVHLGAQLDVGALLRSRGAIRLAVVLAAAAVAVHVGAALVWRLPVGAGLLASAQLGVPAAAVAIGLADRQLAPAQGAAILAAMLASLGACAAGAILLGHHRVLHDAAAPVRPAGEVGA